MIHHAFTSGAYGCVCTCGQSTDNAHVTGSGAAMVAIVFSHLGDKFCSGCGTRLKWPKEKV